MYSFTEKKRIRKTFGKQKERLAIPDMLRLQTSSYSDFLQLGVAEDKRENKGLHNVFKSIFPIVSTSANAELQYLGYRIEEPEFNVEECKLRGRNYAAALKVTMRLVFRSDKGKKPTTSGGEMREQEVFLGDLPLMTKNGSFIINGTERVVVSQLHRSPGVFFEHDKGKTHSSGKLLHSARIIPYYGSWIDFEFDPKDCLFVRIDRKRKLPATILLHALGLTDQEILDIFFETDSIEYVDGVYKMKMIPERLRGEILKFDVVLGRKVLVEAGRRVTAVHVKRIKEAKITNIQVPTDYVIARLWGTTLLTRRAEK